MVFGLFASVATDLMFLSVQVQYLLRSTYLSWPVSCAYSVYFNGFAAAVSAAWGTVANTRFLACSVYILCVCILTVSKLQFRQREARLRTHGFGVGFRWCSAFSHPSPPTSCFCRRRFGNCYGPLICFDLCSVYTLYILTVSKLQFRQREARLRTHGFWLCSAFSHPLPPTSCFCLCRFGTCYGPLTCLDLCSV